jgi:hypothetical protein
MKRPDKRKTAILAGAWIISCLLIFAYGLAAGVYKLPPYQFINSIKDLIITKPTDAAGEAPQNQTEQAQPTEDLTGLNKIVQLIDAQHFSTATEKIDFVREFVHNNSEHRFDDESKHYAYNTPKVLQMLYDHYQTQSEAPGLICDTRSTAMIYIYEQLGIRSRFIHIYSDDFDTLQSHTFLEVFNDDTNRWEVQDSDYDVYYTAKNNQSRLSALQLVLSNLNNIQIQASTQGAIDHAADNLLPHYFEAVVYRDEAGKPTQVIVNTDRFSIDKVYANKDDKPNQFIPQIKRLYGDIPILEMQTFR